MVISYNEQENKYAITELDYNEMVRMANAFPTISNLIDLVHYDEDFHKRSAMEVKKTYKELSDSLLDAIDYEGGAGIESYILPSIATEILALKKGIRIPSKD